MRKKKAVAKKDAVENSDVIEVLQDSGDVMKFELKDVDPAARIAEMFVEEAELIEKKNADYAANGDFCGNFDRVQKIMSNYPNIAPGKGMVHVAIGYVMKQIDAIQWNVNNGTGTDCEDLGSKCMDVSNYFRIIRLMMEVPKIGRWEAVND